MMRFYQTVPLLLVSLLSVFGAGCAPLPTKTFGSVTQARSWNPDTRSEHTPIMGIVADSQLQTRRCNDSYRLLYKSTLSDRAVGCTLRPPALDAVAPAMLEYLLLDLKRQGAEVIFYLGDGANNGCWDELYDERDDHNLLSIDGVFTILERFRSEHEIPVFFVLGNHDFLGAGNTSKVDFREALCDDHPDEVNRIVTKLELMEDIDRFNRRSADQFGENWSYCSNLLEEDGGAFLECCERVERKESIRERQHDRRGCYLASIVTFDDSVQYLLADSCDYYSTQAKPEAGSYEFWGVRGSISFYGTEQDDGVPSQVEWFERKIAALGSPKAEGRQWRRLFLSHHCMDDLRAAVGGLKISTKVGRLRVILDAEPEPKDLYWLSAHTHTHKSEITRDPIVTKAPFSRLRGGQQYLVQGINVGSTTDWQPHATLAMLTDEGLVFRDVAILDVGGRLIEATTTEESEYRGVRGRQVGLFPFGLDSGYSYQRYSSRTKERERENVYYNVDKFIKETGNTQEERLRWSAHIGCYAAEYEQGAPGS